MKTNYTHLLLNKKRLRIISNFFIFLFLICSSIAATSAPLYYRSKASGNWTSLSTWETSITGGAPWIPAILAPSAASENILIQSGHTVSVTSSITLDWTTVSGVLEVQTGGAISLSDGSGNDLVIANGGVLRVVSSGSFATTFSAAAGAQIKAQNGGKITIGNGGAVGANFEELSTTTITKYQTGAIFEWNTTTALNFSGNTFFISQGIGAIPVFRLTTLSGTPGGTTAASINGIVEVNTNVTFTGTGAKTFRDGFRGTGTVTLNTSTGYAISASSAVIDGTVSIVLNANLALTNGVTIPVGANINISGASSINKAAGSFLVNGTVDMNTVNISNTTGDVTINGTLKTGNTNGFSGTGATIVSGTINVNAGSTIEYNAAGSQLVNSRSDYKNIKFSGSGTKTLSSGFNPAGTVSITGSAIVEASNFTFGDAGTSLTMDGGRFRMAGTGTKPDMTGTYTLTAGTLEFYNSLGTTQSIRSPITYYNIEVTGTNVGNGLGNITLASGGSFTVKAGGQFEINQNQIAGAAGTQTLVVESGATFKCGNADGFSGGNGTAGNSTSIKSDIETITLASGSTIDYSRATSGGNQVITTALTYPNLILSGTGVKNVTTGTFTLSATGTMEIKSIVGFDAESGTTINFNNRPITARSSATGTASIGDLTGVTVQNATDFIVERYIPSGRKWRFLSVPTNTTQTIKAAWQEGAVDQSSNPVPGYGTIITDNKITWAANGFDSISNGGPSLKFFNADDSSWVGVTSTTSGIANNSGYMIFIRGDRTIKGFAPGTTSTILRTQGGLNYGTRTAIVFNDTLRASIGNPYPSSIDMRTITKAGVQNVFYLWDPKLGGSYGLGGYQTFTLNGGNYTVTPGGGSYGASGSTENLIRSGEAFLVKGITGGGGGSVTLMENAKTYDGTAGDVFFTPGMAEALYCNLYAANTTPALIADGFSVNYDDGYSNGVDAEDATKISNLNENAGLLNNNNLLVVERRKTIMADDTLYIKLTGTRVQNYKWKLRLDNMDVQGRTGFLIDRYLNTSTALNLNGETEVDFSIEYIAGSYAPDRFIIVFNQIATPPLSINLAATRNINGNVDINWNVEMETGIKHYEVEHSADGINFNVINTEASVFNNNANTEYTKSDINSLAADNYYRIKAIRYGAVTEYSPIVKVPRIINGVSIYPNPVTDKTIHIEFGNLTPGYYRLQLSNNIGQVIYTGDEQISSSFKTKTIFLNKTTAPGIYQLSLIDREAKSTIYQVVIK